MSIYQERERTADVSDHASELSDKYLESMIQHHRNMAHGQRLERERQEQRKRQGSQPFVGQCLFCSEPVRHPRAFCDDECEIDYRKVRAIRKNQGLH